jgi:hypothetical protein
LACAAHAETCTTRFLFVDNTNPLLVQIPKLIRFRSRP